MAKIDVLKCYLVDGKRRSSNFIVTTSSVEELFNNAVSDAEFLASKAGGKVYIERTEKTLYISYLDVPDCNLIDVTRVVVQP